MVAIICHIHLVVLDAANLALKQVIPVQSGANSSCGQCRIQRAPKQLCGCMKDLKEVWEVPGWGQTS